VEHPFHLGNTLQSVPNSHPFWLSELTRLGLPGESPTQSKAVARLKQLQFKTQFQNPTTVEKVKD